MYVIKVVSIASASSFISYAFSVNDCYLYTLTISLQMLTLTKSLLMV